MGIVGSIFRRKKSKAERLAILEKGIKIKEADRLYNFQKRICVKRSMIIFSIIIYLLLVIFSIFFVIHSLVFILYPFIAAIIIFVILRCYTRHMSNNQYYLYKMREEKKMLLEDVKVTETYMVAKEILERYGSSEDLLHEPNSPNNPSVISRRTNDVRKKSKAERLAILEKGIKIKEADRLYNFQKRICVKRSMIIFSIIIYLLLVIFSIFFVIHSLVFILYPFIAAIIIFVILRCYTRHMSNNQYYLYKMREEKKMLLEDVKVTETYMVAKEILERYGSSEDLLHEPNSPNNPSVISRRTNDVV